MGNVSVEVTWQEQMREALRRLTEVWIATGVIEEAHVEGTPARVVAAYAEYFVGTEQDPREVLMRKLFVSDYSEMVFVCNIPFVSFCAHHLIPFMGKAHFAYVPEGRIVGLSKIPRMVEVFSKRPQVQEKMTQEIVETFQEVVKPKGCGAMLEAFHLCMAIRGIKKEQAYTRTQAIRGSFLEHPEVRAEFLDGINKQRTQGLWP